MNAILEGLKKWNVSILGQSPAFLVEARKLQTYALTGENVVITGETGTGKEVFAKAIHYLSRRAGKPFVAVNCGAIPGALLENELFGHAAGAFTSANTASQGVVVDADGGTLFLDEIEALTPEDQIGLLRFLEQKQFKPLGARKTCNVKVRLVAAANIDFEAALRDGRIREDFYYRFSVLRLHLPPLRTRAGDITLLAKSFLAKFANEAGKTLDFAPAALDRLEAHSWPGNVRELENVIKRAIALSQGNPIQLRDISFQLAPRHVPTKGSFKDQKAACVKNFETSFIRDVLTEMNGNIARAAKAACLDRRAFYRMMKKHRFVWNGNGHVAQGKSDGATPSARSNSARAPRRSTQIVNGGVAEL